jgi:hypothetical protein
VLAEQFARRLEKASGRMGIMAERVARTETQSAETTATVAAVIGLLASPTNIPRWAPDFADRVAGDATSGWRANKGDREFPLRVVIDREAGTADYLRQVAPGREGGAYIRAVPRPGGGSVVIMTVPLLPDVDPADTQATLSRELTALMSLVEEA